MPQLLERNPADSDLWDRVDSQKAHVPAMYGQFDFRLRPERLSDPDGGGAQMAGVSEAERARVFANPALLRRLEGYTLMGDTVADAYAALMPQHGFRRLVDMLVLACDKGVEAVQDAPPELVAFIRAMEATPDWVDMAMVERGAAQLRNATAHLAPYAIRGAFIATFMNKYAALPMALTGTLSNKTAARRVKETGTFFATSVMPGALERHGPGFKAAAMVRLMHSMVRFNVLSRSRWDQAVYGFPIPHVDQMPAGLIGDFLMARAVLREGRTSFTEDERARLELSRYRCFLLGLPQELLADTPQGIIDLWLARYATIRDGWDDATCGALLRATMEARLVPGDSLAERVQESFEKSFAKLYFLINFCDGKTERALEMGVPITAGDRARAVLVALLVNLRMMAYNLALKVPGLAAIADRRLVAKIARLLESYGHAEFTTDAAAYRPAVPQPAAS
jgi:hypothetical protein